MSAYNLAELFASTIESEHKKSSSDDNTSLILGDLFDSLVQSEGYNTDELNIKPLFSSVHEEETKETPKEADIINLADLFGSTSDNAEEEAPVKSESAASEIDYVVIDEEA